MENIQERGNPMTPNPIMECLNCNGTGKEICDSPDHNIRNAIGGLRLEGHANGCPCCGNDPDHIVPNSKCSKCGGIGLTTSMSDEKIVSEVLGSLFNQSKHQSDIYVRQRVISAFRQCESILLPEIAKKDKRIGELEKGILKQGEELKYIDGIVTKGTGVKMLPDDTFRDRILNYVKLLEVNSWKSRHEAMVRELGNATPLSQGDIITGHKYIALGDIQSIIEKYANK